MQARQILCGCLDGKPGVITFAAGEDAFGHGTQCHLPLLCCTYLPAIGKKFVSIFIGPMFHRYVPPFHLTYRIVIFYISLQ